MKKILGVGDVDPAVLEEFERICRDKRRPLTRLAVQSLRTEGKKAGMTLDQVMRKCVEKGWASFEASWLGAGVANTTVPAPAGPDPALAKIEADSKKATPPSPSVRKELARLRQSYVSQDREVA